MVVKDTKMSIANNTDDGWGDDGPDVLEMEAEYQVAKNADKAKKQQENKQKKGRLWIFRMPAPDTSGTSTATGRILNPELKNCVSLLVHTVTETESGKKWQKIPCKKFIGLDCEFCDRICEKYGITWEELSDPNKMAYLDTYASEDEWKYKTTWFYVWYFWLYNAFNERGNVRLFAYARNGASPIDELLTINKKRTDGLVAKGKKPVYINQYDISLTQTVPQGDERKRRITPYPEDPEPFEYWDEARRLVGHDMGPKHLLYDTFIAFTYDEDEIKKLRKLAAEQLGDASYLVEEDNSNDSKKQTQPVRKATSPPPPDLTDEEDDVEDFEIEDE